MKIAEYINRNAAALPPALAELLLQEGSIWTNDACYGYCIQAMEYAGFPKDRIIAMLHHLHEAFSELSVEDAEKKYINY